ncbi:hypothetical protein MuYL_4286 [Mucilaginibacter xinganensis]|uniref:Uncharacterized protein n=1 Tax=Mucilaginibacter xinganensis TaxID=1234841 RepID=A0A223P2X4_9SPHI|nr:hypothetical protein MuYL_4286 [Mucilaginibacter xinganensis]
MVFLNSISYFSFVCGFGFNWVQSTLPYQINRKLKQIIAG